MTAITVNKNTLEQLIGKLERRVQKANELPKTRAKAVRRLKKQIYKYAKI